MSELKARHVADVYDDYAEQPCEERSRVYLKSEDDKVIAELKHDVAAWMDSYEVSRKTNARTESELRYQKHKRCLAMAKWCEERYNYLTCLENWQMTDKEYQQVIGDYWDRWNKRWLKIAEKFKDKEAK